MLDKFLRTIKAKNRTHNTVKSIERNLIKAQEEIGKPLETITYDEILSYVERRQEEGLSASSVHILESKLIQFYKYCFNVDEDVKYSKVLRQLKNLKTDQPKIKINPKDILLPEEIKRLINVATLERDRCIVSVLYEGGLRMGELLALTTDMVEMNKKNQEVILHIPDVEGCKTGARSVMCMEIYGYVNDWLKCNPTSRFIPMSPSGISSAVDVLFKRAGITKPSNLHNIRHSSITNAVNIGMQQNMICMRYWGAVFTPMLNVYIHLNEQMTNQGYRNAKGMGEGNGKTVINPLASRCVECGNLIQSGSLCKACTDTKKLTQENQQTKEQLENLIIINKKHMDENSMLKTQMEATQKGYEELKKQMELVTAAMTAMQ